MANYFGAAEDLIGGIGGLLGGNASAKGATAAATSYAQAARLSLASNQIKQAAVNRDIYKTFGGMKATAAANGLSASSGNVQDLIRDSARQGAIAKAAVSVQGDIDYNSYMAQSSASAAQAQSSKSGGFMSFLGGAIGAVGALFSDDDLKEDVTLLRRRPDGVGIYRFRYTGSAQFFEGAMASDVAKVYPNAVQFNDDGIRMVDYDAIKMDFRRAA